MQKITHDNDMHAGKMLAQRIKAQNQAEQAKNVMTLATQDMN